MRAAKLSGIALAAGLAACAHQAAEAPPPPPVSPSPSTSAVPVSSPPPNADQTAAGAMPAGGAMGAGQMGAGWDGPSDEYADSLRDHHRHHHWGVAGFIALSLDNLGVDDNQRAQIEQIRGDLWRGMAPARAAEKSLMTAVADGVAMGTVDTMRIDGAVMNLASASSAANGASADALNRLHAVLTPVQRQVLADKVDAHWQVWKKVNRDDAEMGRDAGTRLAHLSSELDLSPAQVEQISMKLRGPQGAPDKFDAAEADLMVRTFADAFASDTFDATRLGMGNGPSGRMSAHGAHRMVRFYAAVTPVLTPEQRTTLAADLREHGNHPAANAMN